eukprot:364779-Chlamydomonas_euryale.AAC.19
MGGDAPVQADVCSCQSMGRGRHSDVFKVVSMPTHVITYVTSHGWSTAQTLLPAPSPLQGSRRAPTRQQQKE